MYVHIYIELYACRTCRAQDEERYCIYIPIYLPDRRPPWLPTLQHYGGFHEAAAGHESQAPSPPHRFPSRRQAT